MTTYTASVVLYNKGYQQYLDTNAHSKVMFETYEDQQKYVEEERQYCKNEYVQLFRAFTKHERLAAREDLARMCTAFAKYKGFSPSKQNKYEWVKND